MTFVQNIMIYNQTVLNKLQKYGSKKKKETKKKSLTSLPPGL